MDKPELVFVTGPNASGKSSFIRTRISQLATFDIIMPDVYKSRTFEVFENSLKSRNDIALETVFNEQRYKNLIDKARNAGYHTRLIALFLNNPQDSLDRSNQRRVNENGLPISKGNVLLNFNENFKNVAYYYFYFDQTDFIYTGTNNENLNIMTFQEQALIRYQYNEFSYIKQFAEFSYVKDRLTKEAFDIISLNNDYSKNLNFKDDESRRFKL